VGKKRQCLKQVAWLRPHNRCPCEKYAPA
jgi:hypothetical protein